MKESKASAREVWSHLVSRTIAQEPGYAEFKPQLDVLLSQGPLSRRVLKAVGASPDRRKITDVYRQLSDCLFGNVAFTV